MNRRFCTSPHHHGPRWLLSVYFPNGKNYCATCLRTTRRLRRPGPKLDPAKLPAEPFRSWLSKKAMEIPVTSIAASVGVSERVVRTYVDGFYWKYFQNGSKRRYEIKYVQVWTVDRYMGAFQEHPTEIYPDLY